MKQSFGEALLAARKQTGMSQQQLADSIPVNRSSVANWEADRRLPDALIIAKIAEILGVNISDLLEAASEDNARPVVIIVDDSKIILTGGLPVGQMEIVTVHVQLPFQRDADARAHAEHASGDVFGDR